MRAGRVPTDEKQLLRLAEAWVAAREHTRAEAVLARAAEQASDGEVALRLAQVRVEARQWAPALEALDMALSKGVKARGEVQFLRGVSALELGREALAEQAFTAALDDPRRRRDARAWLTHLRQRAS